MNVYIYINKYKYITEISTRYEYIMICGKKKSTELNTSMYIKMIYSSIICIPTSLHTHT